MAVGYCSKCGSKLFPDDMKYINGIGVCGYCATWKDVYRTLWSEYLAKQETKKKRND